MSLGENVDVIETQWWYRNVCEFSVTTGHVLRHYCITADVSRGWRDKKRSKCFVLPRRRKASFQHVDFSRFPLPHLQRWVSIHNEYIKTEAWWWCLIWMIFGLICANYSVVHVMSHPVWLFISSGVSESSNCSSGRKHHISLFTFPSWWKHQIFLQRLLCGW